MFQSFRIEYQGFQCQNKIISEVCTLNPRVRVRSCGILYILYKHIQGKFQFDIATLLTLHKWDNLWKYAQINQYLR